MPKQTFVYLLTFNFLASALDVIAVILGLIFVSEIAGTADGEVTAIYSHFYLRVFLPSAFGYLFIFSCLLITFRTDRKSMLQLFIPSMISTLTTIIPLMFFGFGNYLGSLYLNVHEFRVFLGPLALTSIVLLRSLIMGVCYFIYNKIIENR